ncbi:NAD(P)/FAD-dependent oxidoreductase [Nonomuraea africana]|uniref:Protoporphyrinogen oxidase n=1 Tax=Nonomuraea africana TaxID=46171 RepID=A0ABR9KTX0_9ACTN|nr:NAD(P)/FAD-dependent oxidoreductase [Nonomuraea africana]MBE1565475.1 protoporphyrinogen oxidase [Nonomuraea africana]
MDYTPVVIAGAGPAGLTAAYELRRRGVECTVFEADAVVGGISRTAQRDGWRFDIGGHRFFTKVRRVEAFWNEILDDDDFLLRPRMSRIYYKGNFYDYPLKAANALKNLGIYESFRCVGSYAWARLRPPADQSTFEGWVAARFGWRLYGIFFKTYTEKVWGVPATSIQADWAAQRIKNLSLGRAILNALMPRRNQKEITSLIEEFRYPKYGPGMMWEACADKLGSAVRLNTRVERISRGPRGLSVTVRSGGQARTVDCQNLISTMPMNHLIQALDTGVPDAVAEASAKLKFRDFLTIALVVPEKYSFPDNWIYIHSPEVRLGRVQNYGSWSPHLVQAGRTCLGLEYFVNEGDDLWESADHELVRFGTEELERLGLVHPGAVQQGYVVRMPKAYPVYDADYAGSVETLRKYLEVEWPEIHPVGRNGMHRYNNQDHSMLTAMLTVENIVHDAQHDIWSVNVEAEYHEEGSDGRGTGRSAPVFAGPGARRS